MNGVFHTRGDQQFEAQYPDTDFELVMPEPANCLAGILIIGLVGINQGCRLRGLWGDLFGAPLADHLLQAAGCFAEPGG